MRGLRPYGRPLKSLFHGMRLRQDDRHFLIDCDSLSFTGTH